ncbi:Na+/H+ antiporter subunit A [Pseudalkalibacillus berkeleyi]|uniref:Na+/H+ antiporter subunit A n=1 Tax=Pseudalkalibacillus berkeleyi TaxID=1069813 RepID=A0ABS9H2B8_9BACL|nr:Na+/H+ antiporter subunit A [Pseudalkalibacillus berkeleyi]MCF6138003.1 Na+/H+ antiporter subunit A [Pseudalkalibacillus berkeleyi]
MLQFAVLAPFLTALFVPFFFRYIRTVHTGWFVLPIPFVLFIYFLSQMGSVSKGINISSVVEWVPSLEMNFSFYLDGLSLLFSLLISGIGALVTLYSIFYLNKNEKLNNFYVFLFIFMGAMLGVVLSDNVYGLYLFWELTSISSFLLIGYWYDREASRYGALKSMVITVLGGLSMLGGFILLSYVTGTTSIREMIAASDQVIDSPYFTGILLLILLGAFTKSAQFPFHIWLPDAMEAPTPVSAFLHSATMVKAGIYLTARLFPIFGGTDLFFILVTGFGLLTLCWGSYMAVRQTDLKAILAFSTISQLGMIMSMLGFGTKAAIFAAIFHIFNHATFKGSLFMVAGIIDHETGTRDIRKLGGLMTLMPISATLAFFGTFSMAGVPLPFFNGFLSKEMFFETSLHITSTSDLVTAIAPIIPVLAVLGSIFTFVYSMYFFFYTFTGNKKDELPVKPHEAPIGMLLSPIVLVVFVIVVGLLPNLINEPILTPAAIAVFGSAPGKHIAFWHGFAPQLYMSLTVVALGTVLFLTLKYWRKIYNWLPGPLSANKVYDFVNEGQYKLAERTTNSYMTGSLRHYVLYILVFLVGATGITLFVTEGFVIETDDLAPISWPEIAVGMVMAIAAFATIVMKNRIAAILVLGIVGYGLSLLFVFFRAPDLALTQLIVETVTVALFLLCFYHLPKLDTKKQPVGSRIVNMAISISVGVLVTMVAIASHSSKKFETIAHYFIKESHHLGGGDNVVNVILVDMRGLDTLFEITVLGIAALGIYAMIRLRKEEETD